MGCGIWASEKSGIWDMDLRKMWDVGEKSTMWDVGAKVPRNIYDKKTILQMLNESIYDATSEHQEYRYIFSQHSKCQV